VQDFLASVADTDDFDNEFHGLKAVTLAVAQSRQMSLNGSGDIAVYRTVLVMLAWPR
jgi:hypothetical protein